MKPTRYIYRTCDQSDEEINRQKDQYIKLGYRVVIYREGEGDSNTALLKLIKNHTYLQDT
ncbi:MAG: hypothetical protein K0S76_2636 [Herbinix sp.]|nr:hypothetical protein [Herbinix sp.]